MYSSEFWDRFKKLWIPYLGGFDQWPVDLDEFQKYQEKGTAQLGGNLSGGQQQMLAAARALMSRPKLMLMDEPSTGLSPILVGEVANIIREINKTEISVLLVEQNSRMALKLANRAYILELGKVVLQGEAEKLGHDERIKKYYLGGG